MAGLVGLVLAAAAIALAWLIYRLERLHARHRELDAALAVVSGVKRGMVDGIGDDAGWAELYFAIIYTDAPNDQEADRQNRNAYEAVQNRWTMQVFPVPLAPLELLVASPGLVSDDTVFLASWALWKMQTFNQWVRMQADFNARHAVEIRNPHLDRDRREQIAGAAAWISDQIHVYGIDRANAEGGWYARLKVALDADIARLSTDRKKGLFDYPTDQLWLLAGDLAVGLTFVGFLAALVASWD
jgi:hypothetical protein